MSGSPNGSISRGGLRAIPNGAPTSARRDTRLGASSAKATDRQRNVLSFRLNTPIAETRTAPWRGSLGDIKAPTLVIHGKEDPVLPYPHGVALAKEIPGASLLTIEGMGHELPRGAWPQIVPAIVEHSKARG